MPYLDSELNDAAVFTLIPNGPQNAHVTDVTVKNSRAGAPMAQLDWQVDEGEYVGRKIRFDTIMLGGMSKDQKPISLSQLCQFLHHTGVPWTCKSCGAEHKGPHSFLIATAEHKDEGLKNGGYYCPSCKNPKPRIAYDTDNFKGARCGVRIGSRKQQPIVEDGVVVREGSDKEFNEIQAYMDLVQ